MKTLVALLALMAWLPVAATEAEPITTIELHNRPADELIPIIKPMLGARDSIVGQGFKLFVRTPPETLTQIKSMLRSLDVAAQSLLISVFQGSDRDLRALRVDAGFQAHDDRGSVTIGNAASPPGGGDIRYSTHGAGAGIGTLSTRGRLQDNPIHQLRVSDGGEGYIETGRSIAYFSGAHWIAPGTVVGGIDYKDVNTGFYVRPRVTGDQVILQVSPFKQTPSRTRGGDIDTQRTATTLRGRLGTWLPIGGVSEQTHQAQTRIGGYAATDSRNNESIWIKADLVNQGE